METINLFSKPGSDHCNDNLLTSFLDKYEDLFAFQYKPNTEGIPQSRGWNLYDAAVEYGRMGVPNEYWKQTALNQNYDVLTAFIYKIAKLPFRCVKHIAVYSMFLQVLIHLLFWVVLSFEVKGDYQCCHIIIVPKK